MVPPPVRRQVLIDAICGRRDTWNIVRHSGWSGGVRSTIGNVGRAAARGRSRSSNCSRAPRAVIVRDEQEAALEQILPQPLHLDLAEARRARILHEA